ncbi:MAG TPA: hypothetical protein DCQ29_11030 [Chitinophagaceae bacterium]|nr:hypothetical protein [Chitinophagaceae bacterium]
MKIAVFSTHVLWPSHYETELELIQSHIDNSDTVINVVCNGDFKHCDQNMTAAAKNCYKCINKRLVGVNLIDGKYIIKGIDAPINYKIDIPASQEAIKQLMYRNFDIGYAALSSLISFRRDPMIHPSDSDLLSFLINKGVAVYEWVKDFLHKEKIDKVYVFNGRFIYNRAILRASQQLGIPVDVHERGADVKHYELYKNTYPHDIKYIYNKINIFWETSEKSEEQKLADAQRFFIDRKNGVEQSWFSFVKNQAQGKLPSNWDVNKKNIVFFNSSEDEFAAIGDDWKRFIYPTQVEAIETITKDFLSQPLFHFYLRIHPNLMKVENKDMEKLLSIQSRNLTLIYPDDDVSSYALIEQANKVITFGSTVGIEAAFWKTPSILLGSCFYRDLGATYNPSTQEELYSMLNQDLIPLPNLGALKYGFYLKNFGIPFKYYKAEGIFSGTFKGYDLNKPKHTLPIRILRKIYPNEVPVKLMNRYL